MRLDPGGSAPLQYTAHWNLRLVCDVRTSRVRMERANLPHLIRVILRLRFLVSRLRCSVCDNASWFALEVHDLLNPSISDNTSQPPWTRTLPPFLLMSLRLLSGINLHAESLEIPVVRSPMAFFIAISKCLIEGRGQVAKDRGARTQLATGSNTFSMLYLSLRCCRERLG